jgi:hypothetical protein
MADTADRLAAAIRQVIDDAVQAALRSQQPSAAATGTDEATCRTATVTSSLPTQGDTAEAGRQSVDRVPVAEQWSTPSVNIGRRRFVTAAALNAYIDGLK